MSDSTLLELTGIDLGDYSCRGLTMTLAPVASQDGLRRSINGDLLDLTAPQFRKYSAVISCEDQDSPELIGIWQGMPVTVVCVPGLAGGTDNPSASLTLSMLVDTWDTSRDEWGALTSWRISLLEV